MGLYNLSLDCDCCVIGDYCMSVSTPMAMTWFYTAPHAQISGGRQSMTNPGYNLAYTTKQKFFGTQGTTTDTPALPDACYIFYKTMNHNPGAWVAPPEPWNNWPNFPNPLPSSQWGGWVWCANIWATAESFGGGAPPAISNGCGLPPFRHQKEWEHLTGINACKYSCPLFVPADVIPNEDEIPGELCGPILDPANPSQEGFTFGLSGIFTRDIHYWGFGKLQDSKTRDPYSGNWFDYLSDSAAKDFFASSTSNGHEFTFNARSRMTVLSRANVFKINYNQTNLGPEPTGFVTEPVGTTAGVTHSAKMTMRVGGNVEEAVEEGISSGYGEDVPWDSEVSHEVKQSTNLGCSTSQIGEWTNIDEWLRELSPADSLFLGVQIDPREGVEPSTLTFDLPIHLNIPQHPNHGGSHQESWKYVYQIRAKGWPEIEVTDLDDGRKGMISLGGRGLWFTGTPPWASPGQTSSCA